MNKSQLNDQQVAIKELKKLLKPNDVVYTILRHVSQSGMYRSIDLVIIRYNKYSHKYEPRNISYLTSRALDYRIDKHDGLGVSGCGMDMGFHVVYSLSHVLFPKGFKVKGIGRNGDTSGHDSNGGYALKQQWI